MISKSTNKNKIMIQNILTDYKTKITPIILGIINRPYKVFVWQPTFLGDSSEKAKIREETAFKEKQIKMREGDIAQAMIGNWYGYEDLGIGHETGVDCRKLDNTQLLEIKNKWNTCNSGSSKTVKDKLAKYKNNNPNTECIWGIINPKSGVSGKTTPIQHNGVEILQLQGDDLFRKIFIIDGYDYTNDVRNIVKNIMYN